MFLFSFSYVSGLKADENVEQEKKLISESDYQDVQQAVEKEREQAEAAASIFEQQDSSTADEQEQLIQSETVNNNQQAESTSPSTQNKLADSEMETVQNSDEEQLTFDVWEYRVEGNKLLSSDIVELAVYPYLGPNKSIDVIEQARVSLEKAYRDNGYGTVFVDIPEQDVDNGIVVLNITAGKVDNVKITGSRYYSLGKIREQVPALKEGETPYLPELQEQLADLNRGVAGRTITPVLKPGKTPGKLDVELKVKDEFPLHGSIDLNDRFIVGTTRTRLEANIRYDNLWQKSHSASLGYVVAPEDRSEVEVLFGTYLLRFPGSDNLVALYAVNSDTDVASTGEINQIGIGRIFGARAIFPLPALGFYTHSLSLGADYKDFEEATQLLGVDALNTPISYISFIPSYTGNWFHKKGKTSLTLETIFGTRGLGNTAKEFSNKRVGAVPNFVYFKAGFEHERSLFFNSVLKARFDTQLSDSPLINNEQFAAGGYDTVRGYFEAQELGDDAYVGSVELHSPSFASALTDYLNDLHFYLFADAARVEIQEPLPDQVAEFSLASVGLGMELSAFDGFNADMLWAYPLKKNDDIKVGESRVHFNFGYQF